MKKEEQGAFRLRPLLSDDTFPVYQLMSDRRVTRYMEGVSPLEEIAEASRFIGLIDGHSDTSTSFVLGIVDESDRLVGLVGFDEMDDEAANLFFALKPEYWGKGIMTEMMARYLSTYGDKVSRIVAGIHADNVAALRMIRKFDKVIVEEWNSC